ncbi:MAG: GC-type dockerin domain-anchored protein [Phycisphaerales bacterium]
MIRSVCALGVCFAMLTSVCWGQLEVGEVNLTTRVEASGTERGTFESFLDEQERELMVAGSLVEDLSAFVGIDGGSGVASADVAIRLDDLGLEFVTELSSQVTLGNALNISANAGGAAGAALTTVFETDVAVSGGFILDQPLPMGFTSGAVVLVRFQLLGFSPSNPGEFVNVQSELSSFAMDGNVSNEIRFIDTVTLYPDGMYSLLVQATVSTGVDESGAASVAELSGRFVARLDYVDTDQDGLFDAWEDEGIDFEMDGVPEIDLPGMGAAVDQKDLFVEIDVHASGNVSQDVLDQVVDSFENAPVSNPNGFEGINLHMDIDENSITDMNYVDDQSGSNTSTIRNQLQAQRENFFGTPAERASPISEAVIQAKSLVYRYGVVGGKLTVIIPGRMFTPGGMGEIIGDDFVITLQNPDLDPGDQARTIMHELGHNLGLRHGGDDNVNYKPNYFSVMNYMHVYRRTNWGAGWNDALRTDFSRSKLPDVDEFNLSESAGIASSDPSTADRLFVFGNDSPVNPSGDNQIWAARGGPGDSVDWDVDGALNTEGFALDVNRINPMAPPNLEVHVGHDDWNDLYMKLRGNMNFEFGQVAPGESTLDAEVGEFTLGDDGLDDLSIVYLDGDDCPADLTGEGDLNFLDVSAFLAAFGSQDPAADFAGDGNFNFLDVSAFLAAFAAGCS